MKKRLFVILLITAAAYAVIPGERGHSLGSREAERETDNFFALGTACSISLYTDRKGRVSGTERLSSEIFEELQELTVDIEDRMSVRIEGSEIDRVNKAAGQSPVTVSGGTFDVIEAGLRYSELSGGAFDISIGPLVALWDIGGDGAAVPEEADIIEALALVDYRRVEMDPDSPGIYLPEAGMRLEPGGIAKGFAADSIASKLGSEGVESALINLGGNVLVMGRKPDGSRWKIGIQNPFNPRGDYIGILEAEDLAIVSSGKYERFFIEDGVRYHHILSTTDGFPVENGLAQVTMVCSESMKADALSTSVFSLGLQEGMKLVESIPDAESIIITEEKEIRLTGSLAERFKLTDNSFSIIGD